MSPAGGWRISGPFLSDAEREQVVQPGGLSKGMREPTAYERETLFGLQLKSQIYGGTVDPVTVAHRRARNKAARKSRRHNRRAR
jgi:hypothetical protein